MQKPSMRDERGIALVLSIVALVVIGAIVAGTMFVSTAEQRTSYNGLAASKAFEAADAGLQSMLADWNTNYNSLAVGVPTAAGTGDFTATSGATYADTIVRLNNSLFLLKSVGSQGGATQTLGAIVRLLIGQPNVQAAVTARGDVGIGGNATVRGQETTPANWSCSTSPDMAGIRTSGSVNPNGNSYTLSGNPQSIQHDASVTSDVFMTPFNQLKAMRTLPLPGSNYNGLAPTASGSPATCNKLNSSNWGEPWRAPTGGTVTECISYSPIVYLNGNSSVQNGRGQGVLLVEGDLDIRGNFEWTGLVITTGQVTTRGTGSKITGAVMAQNVSLADQTSFLGNPTVALSMCAVNYVLQQSAQPTRIAARPWMQMY